MKKIILNINNWKINAIFLFIISLYLLSSCQANADQVTWRQIYYKQIKFAQGWKYIIVHHSATKTGNASSFHRYHTKQGYGGLAYHFVIDNGSKDGKIEQGFRWKKQIAGTHVSIQSWYHNIFGIGICLVGNFNKTKPTVRQMNSLIRLSASLAKKYNIPIKNIIGHKEVYRADLMWNNQGFYLSNKKLHTYTACPGKNLNLKRLRRRISQYMRQGNL